MSSAARHSIVILIILLLASFGFAGNTFLQKLDLEKANKFLEKQLDDYQKREKVTLGDKKKLENKIKSLEEEKKELEDSLSSFNVDIDSLDSQIQEISKERDAWRKKVEGLREERNNLLTKLQSMPTPEILSQIAEQQKETQKEEIVQQKPAVEESYDSYQPSFEDDESYWADVLKEKVRLSLQVENLKTTVSEKALAVVELQKANTDLQLKIDKLSNTKDQIERNIKNANDLADILSLQLARSQNDRKFLQEQLTKINDKNTNLQKQIKELTSTKISLEKGLVQLQSEKKEIEKKLFETENIIQSRIDEIWEIKDSIEKSIIPNKQSSSDSGIDLSPIVVSPEDEDASLESSSESENMHEGAPGFDGNVVSVNEENNFVIVDIGQSAGVQIGDNLNVYRNTDYIAGLEVIQVRNDIAAADIKSKVMNVQVGDIVR